MSTESSGLSEASTKEGSDDVPTPTEGREEKPSCSPALQHVAKSASAQDILVFLIAFRILNALTVRTFFQPDEFFQSLEPAWQMAFGSDSGAWITWEWRHHLRSAIHPALFAGVYFVSNMIANLLLLGPLTRADLLIEMPKATQGVIAALGDFYTWKLAQRVYGRGSTEAWGALALTVISPWQWFCSTRTLSNCLETTLTIVALYLWPWQWSMKPEDDDNVDEDGLRTSSLEPEPDRSQEEGLVRLERCLLLAALACVLRPTNLLIWLCLVFFTVFEPATRGWLIPVPWARQRVLVSFSTFSLLRATRKERIALFRQSLLCGSLVLSLSAYIDRLYYGQWTFPPLRFLYFNIAQSLSVFYGRNDWHYYLSQGYPLLLTTALPFALRSLYESLFPPPLPSNEPTPKRITLTRTIKAQLAGISLIVPLILSLISHKEVRFIYPLLPPLHILAASPLISFFSPFPFPSSDPTLPQRTRNLKNALLVAVLTLNALLAAYTTLIHASGPLSTLSYLRHQHFVHYTPLITSPSFSPPQAPNPPQTPQIMTVGFLMPCHSTPWRSHLISPSIHAWALSCEPPVSLSSSEKSTYLDEADQFYADPADFLRRTMPRTPGGRSSFRSLGNLQGSLGLVEPQGKRQWPDYLVFFAHLESTMGMLLKGSGYRECHRTFNSHAHDDWRRKGDIVVWCLRADELAKANVGRAHEDKAGAADKAHADKAKAAEKAREAKAKAAEKARAAKAKDAEKARAAKAKNAEKARAAKAKVTKKQRDNEKWAREKARAKEEKLKGLVKRAEKGSAEGKGQAGWWRWERVPGWADDLWA